MLSAVQTIERGVENAATPADRFYRFPELKTTFGIPWTRQHVARLERAGRFPRRIHVGARVVWRHSELVAWQRALVEARDRESR